MPRFAVSRDLSIDPRRGVLALRERSERHPMAMFFVIVALAFAAAALLSPSRASLSVLGTPALSGDASTGKTSRLAAVPEIEIACRGQAWGAESEACLRVIARESGRGEAVRIRLVAAGTPDATTPNVF